MWYSFRPYVPVAKRRAQAAREVQNRIKKGQTVSPVVIQGRTIASTFWGKAWNDNLESYSDFENRLPRGRTYVRNGSVVDLQIHPGKLTALVSGSELYTVDITITPLPAADWQRLKTSCAGKVGSLVELLRGRLSKDVIRIVTERGKGLFPKPGEIKMECSCPDWAGMCKHIAAVLYGVGARLDHQPELLFRLRKVDHLELIEDAVAGVAGTKTETTKKTLAANEVADVFGIEIAEPQTGEVPAAAPVQASRQKAPRPPVAKPASSRTKKTAKKGSGGVRGVSPTPTPVKKARSTSRAAKKPQG
jgi:uncharacterized Zn finger protein